MSSLRIVVFTGLLATSSCKPDYVDLALLPAQPSAITAGRAIHVRADAGVPAAAQVRVSSRDGTLAQSPESERVSTLCLALVGDEVDTILFVHPSENQAIVTAEVVSLGGCDTTFPVGIEPAILVVDLVGNTANGGGGTGGDGGGGAGGGGAGGGGAGAGGAGGADAGGGAGGRIAATGGGGGQ